ncbi:carboxylating nicotinate-nucleotide diphosphorylase [Microlunatus soli]|uniref:Nicotinate-nucleotide pyrophosphorylase [carboxylating] n=1 Tax=Microlunatus soli TaxID=630515 RepID=A0A1H1RBB7_9ACTN|nr:carboxylating nicotinate-nucleotide diphosphorylase [Microlunatus soli]SDS32209.1 nicotinate-nucleotide pyrophosphorylase [carboxylating] [Microlunatus soli]
MTTTTAIDRATIDDQLRVAGLDPAEIAGFARSTLAEDLQWGPDLTTEATIPADQQGVADVVARAAGTLAGIPVAAVIADELAEQRGDRLTIDIVRVDGDRVLPGDRVLSIAGPLRTLLTAERSLLNVLGQLSGVATATAAWVDAIGDHRCAVRDTRKTVPGLRILQKYAVRCGGGVNHRMGLGDAALIKDNHVAAAGSVRAAFAAVRRADPQVSVEVEVDTLDQLVEALDAGADLILLDNMSPETMRRAVSLASGHQVRLEASGGLTLADAAAVAATGVDYIAVGGLTHSAPVHDLGFDLRDEPDR